MNEKNKKVACQYDGGRYTVSLRLLLLFVVMMAAFILPGKVHAKAPDTPTVEGKLELNGSRDMMDQEGWKWEVSGSNATLTLRNFYFKTTQTRPLILPKDIDVTLVLEGENILETTNGVGNPLIAATGGQRLKSLTIREGAGGGSIKFLNSGNTTGKTGPYVFSAINFTLESGDIYCNTAFCEIFEKGDFNGGSLTVYHPKGSDENLIYSPKGLININGGKLDLQGGTIGIYVAKAYPGEQTVNITGGEVNIKENDGYGICATNITIDCKANNGSVDIYGGYYGLYCWVPGGELKILSAGSINLSGGYTPYEPNINDEGIGVTITAADYTEVDKAIASANALTKENYKDFSAVENAINAVDKGKNFLEQQEVDQMAASINGAVSQLALKDADYKAVDDALAKVPQDLSRYTDESVNKLNEAVNAVVRGKDITEQETVNGYAGAIEAAIKNLTLKATSPGKSDGTSNGTSDATKIKPVSKGQNVPRTDDTAGGTVWAVLLMISGVALTGSFCCMRKRKRSF